LEVFLGAIEDILSISAAYIKDSGIDWECIKELGHVGPDAKATLGKRGSVGIVEGRHFCLAAILQGPLFQFFCV
jgi:hypothetical protein